MHHRW